jgi:hypothetical protein
VAGVRGELAMFVEYDRTHRVDKNYDKFRRCEALLAGWWTLALRAETQRPTVVFICQGDAHRERFLAAADLQLAAYETRSAGLNPRARMPVRDRFLFALEHDRQDGRTEAVRLPRHPPAVGKRDNRVCRVRLPGGPSDG